MSEIEKSTHESVLVSWGRSLGRSRTGQLLVSVAVATLFSLLAYIAWHARDLAATVLTVGLLLYGFRLAGRILPIPSATRARWARMDATADQCPPCQYRGLLWAGICLAALKFWRSDSITPINSYDFIVPGAFVIIGTISYILCHRWSGN